MSYTEKSARKLKREVSASKKIITSIYTNKSSYWTNRGKKVFTDLFREVSSSVVAYDKLLKNYSIDAKNLNSFRKLNVLPVVSKDNYLRKYAWEELCKKGAILNDSLVLTSTSGSTGKPFYFPRNGILDFNSSVLHEIFLKNSNIDDRKSTLVIVCFGMGVWIGGIITYQAFKKIAERGRSISIITPGVNKKEIYEALNNVAPKFDQVIICGYPPFLKDLIDEAPSHGVSFKNINLKIIFAAESFSEKFRDYVCKKTGIKNVYRDTMNIYGSADLGTMAIETPLCILIRKLSLKNRNIYSKIFSDASRLPTLAQFVPDFVNFEAPDREILCSGDNVLPLLRYRIGDNGGVLSYKDIKNIFKQEGEDLDYHIKKAGIEDTLSELPFVYVYERTDFSTKLYGAIIYPEYIKEALIHPTLSRYLTGKFNIYTRHDKRQNEFLEINIELKLGIKINNQIKKRVTDKVVQSLVDRSAEYKDQYTHAVNKRKILPVPVFWPYNHPLYFGGGTKQKWVKKD